MELAQTSPAASTAGRLFHYMFAFRVQTYYCNFTLFSGLVEMEETLKNTMGHSNFVRCQALAEVANLVYLEMGTRDAQPLLAKLLRNHASHTWNQETLNRYITIGKKLSGNDELKNHMLMWDYEMRRDVALDGLTALRGISSCPGLCCSMRGIVTP